MYSSGVRMAMQAIVTKLSEFFIERMKRFVLRFGGGVFSVVWLN
jgi:hypothetical protein